MRHFTYHNGQLYCENLPVADLAQKFGTPLYIYSGNTLTDCFDEIKTAFSGVDTTIAFSVKSCSNLSILRLLRERGAGFDVVSGGELFRAVKAGADKRKIVYSGVGKTNEEIRQALEADILMFNVESEAELDNIQTIAASMGTVAQVALRVNPDVDPHTHVKTTTGKKENKFGIDMPTAARIARNIAEQPNIRLLGLDMHIGSPVNSTEPYKLALQKAVEFIRQNRSSRAQFEYLDMGGGYGLLYRDQKVPAFADYAKTIVPLVKEVGCRLIIEPGRSIAGNSAILVTKVLYGKDNGTKYFTIVDAGMNDLIRPALYDAYHFIWPVVSDRTPPGDLFDAPEATAYFAREDEHDRQHIISRDIDSEGLRMTDVVGPICESSDCFAKERRLPPLERGHLLAVFSSGAYGFSMASTYNSRPRPAEILVDGMTARVIGKRETYESLIEREILTD